MKTEASKGQNMGEYRIKEQTKHDATHHLSAIIFAVTMD
jgi:hypothetical protein